MLQEKEKKRKKASSATEAREAARNMPRPEAARDDYWARRAEERSAGKNLTTRRADMTIGRDEKEPAGASSSSEPNRPRTTGIYQGPGRINPVTIPKDQSAIARDEDGTAVVAPKALVKNAAIFSVPGAGDVMTPPWKTVAPELQDKKRYAMVGRGALDAVSAMPMVDAGSLTPAQVLEQAKGTGFDYNAIAGATDAELRQMEIDDESAKVYRDLDARTKRLARMSDDELALEEEYASGLMAEEAQRQEWYSGGGYDYDGIGTQTAASDYLEAVRAQRAVPHTEQKPAESAQSRREAMNTQHAEEQQRVVTAPMAARAATREAAGAVTEKNATLRALIDESETLTRAQAPGRYMPDADMEANKARLSELPVLIETAEAEERAAMADYEAAATEELQARTAELMPALEARPKTNADRQEAFRYFADQGVPLDELSNTPYDTMVVNYWLDKELGGKADDFITRTFDSITGGAYSAATLNAGVGLGKSIQKTFDMALTKTVEGVSKALTFAARGNEKILSHTLAAKNIGLIAHAINSLNIPGMPKLPNPQEMLQGRVVSTYLHDNMVAPVQAVRQETENYMAHFGTQTENVATRFAADAMYQASMSTLGGSMGGAAALGKVGASLIGAAPMGLAAGEDTLQEGLAQGMSYDRALLRGFASGGIEVATEAPFVGTFMDDLTGGTWISGAIDTLGARNMAKGGKYAGLMLMRAMTEAAGEGGAEMLSTIATNALDAAVFHPDVNEKTWAGMSAEQRKQYTTQHLFDGDEVLQSFVMGAAQRLVTSAFSMPIGTKTRSMADAMVKETAISYMDSDANGTPAAFDMMGRNMGQALGALGTTMQKEMQNPAVRQQVQEEAQRAAVETETARLVATAQQGGQLTELTRRADEAKRGIAQADQAVQMSMARVQAESQTAQTLFESAEQGGFKQGVTETYLEANNRRVKAERAQQDALSAQQAQREKYQAIQTEGRAQMEGFRTQAAQNVYAQMQQGEAADAVRAASRTTIDQQTGVRTETLDDGTTIESVGLEREGEAPEFGEGYDEDRAEMELFYSPDAGRWSEGAGVAGKIAPSEAHVLRPYEDTALSQDTIQTVRDLTGVEVQGNDQQLQAAVTHFNELGYDESVNELYNTGRLANATEEAFLMHTIAEANKRGDIGTTVDLMTQFVKEGTNLGQLMQVRKEMAKMTGAGMLASAIRQAEASNKRTLHPRAQKKIDQRITNLQSVLDGARATDAPGRKAELMKALHLEGVKAPKAYNRATIKQRIAAAIGAATDTDARLLREIAMLQTKQAVVTTADAKYINDQMAIFEQYKDQIDNREDHFYWPQEAKNAYSRAKEAEANIDLPNFLQKYESWRKTSMLLNMRTGARNILSNVVFGGMEDLSRLPATLLDIGISKVTGKRTTASTRKMIVESGRAFARETAQVFADARNQVDTAPNSDKFSMSQEAHGGRVFQNQALETLNASSGFLMTLGDRPFWASAYARSIAEQQTLLGITEITPDMQMQAARDANYATFQEDNMVASAINSLKKANPILGTALDFVIPFSKTPTNIAKRMWTYSPAGLVSTAIQAGYEGGRGEFDQRSFVRNLSRGFTGTGLAAIGYFMAQAGVLHIRDDEEDPDRAALERASGRPYGTYLQIGDQKIEMDWMQPGATPLIIGAQLLKEFDKDKDAVGQAIWDASTKHLDTILSSTMLSNIQNVLSGDSMAQTAQEEMLTSAITQSIPSLVSELAEFVDPYMRDTADKDFWQGLKKRVMQKIPGARNMLPEKVLITGETQENTKYKNLFNAFINPSNVTADQSNDAIREVLRVSDATGDVTFLPTDVLYGKKDKLQYTQGGVQQVAVLDDEQKEEYKKHYGELLMNGGAALGKKIDKKTGKNVTLEVPGLNGLIQSAEYQRMTDAEKRDALEDAIKKAKEGALVELIQKYGK